MSHPRTANALRAHLREHNFSMLAASAVAGFISFSGWLLLYGAAYWVTMLACTVQNPSADGVPPAFHKICPSVVGVLLLLAWLDHMLFPHERTIDERPATEHLMDVALFLPRLSFDVFWNFAAWCHLPDCDLANAAALVDRLRGDQSVPMQHLPISLPDDAQRERIVRALQNARIIHAKADRGLLVVRISPFAPEVFRDPLPRRMQSDELRVKSATVLNENDALPPAKRQLHDLGES